MRYFIKKDGLTCAIDETTNPTTAREYAEKYIEVNQDTYTKVSSGDYTYDLSTHTLHEVIKPQPSRAEIEAQQKADYEREVQSLLASRGYTQDKVQAIVCNSMIENDTKKDEHTKELAELQKARRECKDLAYAKVYKEK